MKWADAKKVLDFINAKKLELLGEEIKGDGASKYNSLLPFL